MFGEKYYIPSVDIFISFSLIRINGFINNNNDNNY